MILKKHFGIARSVEVENDQEGVTGPGLLIHNCIDHHIEPNTVQVRNCPAKTTLHMDGEIFPRFIIVNHSSGLLLGEYWRARRAVKIGNREEVWLHSHVSRASRVTCVTQGSQTLRHMWGTGRPTTTNSTHTINRPPLNTKVTIQTIRIGGVHGAWGYAIRFLATI